METNIKNLIAPEFGEILEHNKFEVADSNYSPGAFGDAFVICKSDNFIIKITKDRGEIFVDVATLSDPTRWYMLEHILSFAIKNRKEKNFGEPPEADKLAYDLAQHYDAVVRLLNSDLDKVGYLKYEKEKTDSVITRIFGSKGKV